MGLWKAVAIIGVIVVGAGGLYLYTQEDKGTGAGNTDQVMGSQSQPAFGAYRVMSEPSAPIEQSTPEDVALTMFNNAMSGDIESVLKLIHPDTVQAARLEMNQESSPASQMLKVINKEYGLNIKDKQVLQDGRIALQVSLKVTEPIRIEGLSLQAGDLLEFQLLMKKNGDQWMVYGPNFEPR